MGFDGTIRPLFSSLVVVPGLEDDDPDKETTGDKRQHGGGHLEVPRPRQVVVEGICSAEPEVLALETEGVVSEDHHRHHDEHPSDDEDDGRGIDEDLLTEVVSLVTEDALADDPQQQQDDEDEAYELQHQTDDGDDTTRHEPLGY